MGSKARTIIGGASFRTFRCLWMLEELGLPYTHVPALPGSEEVSRYNPLGKVPVLVEDDGFSMYESAAINTFLGDKFRGIHPSLVPPPGTNLRGLYEQTVSVLTNEMDSQALWIHRKHESLGDIFTHIPEAVEHARKYFNKTNRSIIGQLKDRGPYLLGEFSAADIIYVHCLDWSKNIGWHEKWKTDPTLEVYLKLCKARPAYKKIDEMRRHEQQQVNSNVKKSKL
jgi:glutathione S-transferase